MKSVFHWSHSCFRKIPPLSISFCLEMHEPEECLCDVSQAIEGLHLKRNFCEFYGNVSSAVRSDKMSIIIKNKTDPLHPTVFCSSKQCSRTCSDQARVTREIKALKLFPSEEQLSSLGHLVLAKRYMVGGEYHRDF